MHGQDDAHLGPVTLGAVTVEDGQDDYLGPVTIGGEPPRVEFPEGWTQFDPDAAEGLAFDATEHLFG